jgi:hypothetical protein
MAANTDPTAIGLPDDELIRKYVHGCHILHYYDIVDAYGHLSVRLSESVFMMSRYMAPALVSSADDMVLYDVESGEALRKDAPKGLPSFTVFPHSLSTGPWRIDFRLTWRHP